MTWSIIAKDNATGQIGIAVATKFFAVDRSDRRENHEASSFEMLRGRGS